jgi:hypothetical protein
MGLRMRKGVNFLTPLMDFHLTHYARSTLPALKQEVQTYILCVPPFTFTLTCFTLDFHILFARLLN